MTIAYVLALLAALTPGADRYAERSVVEAIADAAESEYEAAELVVYAWYESQCREHPVAWSWDARAGLSRGPWQMRYSTTPANDACRWLAVVREHGLVTVDGSPARVARREAVIARILEATDAVP